MKIRHFALTLAIALATPHAIADRAAESPQKSAPAGSYILASESPVIVAGQITESSYVLTMEGGTLIVTTPQGNMKGSMEISTIKTMRTETETAEKVKVLIEKHEEIYKSIMHGREDAPKPQPKPLVGVPLTATLSDGKWTVVRDDGSEPTAGEAKELKSIASNLSGILTRKMYGTAPRKPGDQWTVDAKDTIFNDNGNMTNVVGKIELNFDKVDDYHGMKCAFLSGTQDISGTPGDLPAEAEATYKLASKIAIVRALDLQLDISATTTGTMDMQRKLPDGRIMEIQGPMTLKAELEFIK